jgi:hypothetical protein
VANRLLPEFERRSAAMKYLPIFQELFGSDTVVFLLLGLAGALVVSLALKKQKHLRYAFFGSLVVYAACEAGSNLHTNYGLEMLLLFLGTAALGCALGFCINRLFRLFVRFRQANHRAD